MCMTLSTIRRLCKWSSSGVSFSTGRSRECGLPTSYHHLTLDLKVRVVALMLKERAHVTDHRQCFDVVCELDFGVVGIIRSAAFQRASMYDKGEF